jgi:hypothetical protein
MKNIAIYWLLGLTLLAGCSPKNVNNQISYQGQGAPGTLKMRVTGFGKKQADIEKDAQAKAFEHLLYVGVPDATNADIRNTDFRLPMVKDRSSVDRLPFLKSFFAKQEYMAFIIELNMLDDKMRRAVNKQYTIPYAITINYDAFRRAMEQNGVVRKFGY